MGSDDSREPCNRSDLNVLYVRARNPEITVHKHSCLLMTCIQLIAILSGSTRDKPMNVTPVCKLVQFPAQQQVRSVDKLGIHSELILCVCVRVCALCVQWCMVNVSCVWAICLCVYTSVFVWCCSVNSWPSLTSAVIRGSGYGMHPDSSTLLMCILSGSPATKTGFSGSTYVHMQSYLRATHTQPHTLIGFHPHTITTTDYQCTKATIARTHARTHLVFHV